MAGGPELDGTRGTLTPFRALDAVLLDYARALHDLLGDDLIGLYPTGSLAIGDFDLTSDVDFLVVVRDEPTGDTIERLQSAHRALLARDTRWVRHLEYSVFPLRTLAQKSSPYRPDGHDDDPERLLWYFPNGGSDVERSDHDNSLVTRWTLRYRSRAVVGPDPATFAPEVTADELRREIRSSMLGWRDAFAPGSPFDNRFHQVFFVLNNCRALQDLHEGRVTSKREGVRMGRAAPRSRVASAHRVVLAGAAGHRHLGAPARGSRSRPRDRPLPGRDDAARGGVRAEPGAMTGARLHHPRRARRSTCPACRPRTQSKTADGPIRGSSGSRPSRSACT